MSIMPMMCIFAVCGLSATLPAAGAQEKTGGSDRDLRRQMAGAWRSERRDQVLCFVEDLCVLASEGRQMIFRMRYEHGVARRVLADSGMEIPGTLTIEKGKLVIRIPSPSLTVRYRRLETIPEDVLLDPFPLGTRQPTDAERAAIRREIAERMKRDQQVRMQAIKASTQGGIDPAQAIASIEKGKPDRPEAVERMATVDRENTRRLIELIRDIGWLSKERFDAETQLGAFLIVQHSGNLRLMRTVLPLVEEEAKRDPKLGQYYALLYDRVQLNLGKKQRYGTQAQTHADGSVCIGRLENPLRIDAWRREMGLEPLGDYARSLSEAYGVKVTIGE